jgi:hypothetical protein
MVRPRCASHRAGRRARRRIEVVVSRMLSLLTDNGQRDAQLRTPGYKWV